MALTNGYHTAVNGVDGCPGDWTNGYDIENTDGIDVHYDRRTVTEKYVFKYGCDLSNSFLNILSIMYDRQCMLPLD